MRVILDLPEDVLKLFKKLGENERKSRKAFMETILLNYIPTTGNPVMDRQDFPGIIPAIIDDIPPNHFPVNKEHTVLVGSSFEKLLEEHKKARAEGKKIIMGVGSNSGNSETKWEDSFQFKQDLIKIFEMELSGLGTGQIALKRRKFIEKKLKELRK